MINPEFHHRLAELIGDEPPFSWARRMGISKGAFSRIWNEGSVPGSDHLLSIKNGTGVSLDWLLAGMGLMFGTSESHYRPESSVMLQVLDDVGDYQHSEASAMPKENLDVLVCNRFKEEMKRTKLSYGEVALVCDVTTKTVSRWGSSTPIPSDKLQCLLQTSIDIIYVLTGVRSHHGLISENTAYQNNDFAQIPRYNVQAAAGHGAFNDDEEQLQPLAFRRDWLAKRHLSPASLVIVDVSGNSMEPNLRDGDMVLVDRDQTEVTSGKTYVLRIDGNLFVKNLQLLPQGLVQVCSFNHGFAPYQVDLSNEAMDMAVIGRVVASMHEW